MSKRDESEKHNENCGFGDNELHEVHEAKSINRNGSGFGSFPFLIVLIFLFSVLLCWAGFYFVNYSGGFEALAHNEAFDPSGPLPKPPPEESLFEIGREVYVNCVACHQTTGLGIPGVFPPLAGSKWVLGSSEKVPVIILHGIFGPIEVKGQVFNSAMPPLAEVLSNKEIAAVTTFIRTNSEWGNEAKEVTEEMVSILRDQYGVRGMWTAEELSKKYPE
ncbi:MAG: Cytochrome c-552 [Candidatus Moanabacter tarae]|uniref:Cytochrome c-552 n=1 Tax=Candidatus Moanibacter tarae TaxID=2200854 RepID=A0A2Z4AHR3_9BACT|nr:MAG: Cytochrome c-552 [Candidatus Moanabacter tarae]|tara:strand:- start:58596 stop:59252 length:657 start_codon:yes stop_codon:yes gene_type:complete